MGTLPAPAKPVPLAQYNGELRCALIEEEAREFRDAWAARDRLEMIDALCDLLYVTAGAAVEMGVELRPFFEEVHASNMRKIGGPVRADGKHLKPPGWTPPDLQRVYRDRYDPDPDDPQGREPSLSLEVERPARALLGWMSPEEARLTLNGSWQDTGATTDQDQAAERARTAVAARPSGIDQSEIEEAAASAQLEIDRIRSALTRAEELTDEVATLIDEAAG